MFRWNDVETQTIENVSVKMYRPLYEANRSMTIRYHEEELDLLSYRYLGSEMLWYKILDVNMKAILENRGRMNRLQSIQIPVA